jgi:putative hydrolase of the HAD superfamily
MTQPAVGAVVFDIGGVLVTNPLGEFAKVDLEYGLLPDTAMSFFRGGSLFAQCEIGALPFADFCAASVAQIEADQGIVVPAERLAAMMAAIMGDTIVESMRDLIGEIKKSGVRTGLLSNIYAELDGWMRTAFADDLIDVYCPSFAIGLRKPDPAAYRVLIEQVGLPAEQIVFIDDFPENVTAANDAGIRAILFTGEPELRRTLRELGLDVAA